ncbi:hypothetical protein [Rhodopseudomonas pseudopalustris]|nr:hypothetical protein [Rhodopseudomonas pseudopalustris]SEO85046.1 hypothetical protein SAMN05444123_105187 [Rhodopseudomonas pseudopalustris]
MRKIAWTAFILTAVSLNTPAWAQLTPSPRAVNDCTQLTDPTLLRQCLEAQAGVLSQPEAQYPSETPAPPQPDPYRRLDSSSPTTFPKRSQPP